MNALESNSSSLPAYSGYLFLVGSSIFYGSNFLPVKQYETGDGMFFQLILCIAIWTVGFLVNSIRNFPQFYPLPLLGGFMWAVRSQTLDDSIFLLNHFFSRPVT